MRIFFSLVFFFALLYSIDALECFKGRFSREDASDEEPKDIRICKDEAEKCFKSIAKGGLFPVRRGCVPEDDDYDNGCEERRIEGVEVELCVCSGNRCNAASCILPSYTFWILTFVATTWCKHAFGYQ